jgi:hypothetical protein
MLQRDDCEKAGVPDVLHAAGIHQRPFCCVTILASTDRCLLPSVFILLIHYIWFSYLAFSGESKALSPIEDFPRIIFMHHFL